MSETTITFTGAALGDIVGDVSGTIVITTADPPPPEPSVGRIRLESDLVLYVRQDGSDSNDGLANTSGGAFQTIQAAANHLAASYDLNGHKVVIQVADRTSGQYARVNLPKVLGAHHQGDVTLRGNLTNPENVWIYSESATYHYCIQVEGTGNNWHVEGFKLSTWQGLGSYGDALTVFNNAVVSFKDIEFYHTPQGSDIMAQQGAVVLSLGNYKITGGGNCHLNIQGAQFNGVPRTVTLSGSPVWTTGFAFADYIAMVYLYTTTFSGTGIGPRYGVHRNSVIRANGVTLPGSSAGTTSLGGVYS